MGYNVEAINSFKREAKALIKKYPSLKNELYELGINLSQVPEQGIQIKNNCYKIRLAIASKGKGKSGGARVITYVHIEGTTVYLLTIFDKSEKENITDKELELLLSSIIK
jgi:hypothetical protein